MSADATNLPQLKEILSEKLNAMQGQFEEISKQHAEHIALQNEHIDSMETQLNEAIDKQKELQQTLLHSEIHLRLMNLHKSETEERTPRRLRKQTKNLQTKEKSLLSSF